jgi:tryptophanyl-tRNA synthetase
MNWLERMIQFKEKSRKSGTESVGAGLFTYPVLMTADILLYQAADVPVGEDQRQHLELARDIARRFHDLYCKGNAFKKRCKQAGIPSRPTFTEPNAMIVETGISRIMSLTDGTSKMSKSDPNDQSRINILDPPDLIRQKIKRCKTDSLPGIEWDNPDRPEATNLLNIYRAVTGESREEILERFGSSTWGKFKPELADAIIAHLEPIQNRYHEIRQDTVYLEGVLREGADAANAVANQTLHAAKVAMGFVPPPPAISSS